MRTTLSRRDEGLTLIELMVSALLLTLVMSVVAGIMIGTTTTENSVRTVTSATSAGAQVSRAMERAISNSATPLLLSTPTGTDQLLMARTAGSGTALTWNCTAWYYSAADKTIRTTTSSTAITIPSLIDQRSWTLLSDGVRPISTGSVFAVSGSKLTLAFTEDAGKSSVITFQTTITSQTGATGSAPCF